MKKWLVIALLDSTFYHLISQMNDLHMFFTNAIFLIRLELDKINIKANHA